MSKIHRTEKLFFKVLLMLYLIRFFNPLGCQEALGMESGGIKDAQISASSEWNANHAAIQGRLHFQAAAGRAGSWSAGTNDANQWLQIDLIGHYIVTRVATQGRNGADQWVKAYKLQYGDDGTNFQSYKEPGQNNDKVKLA